jgi:tetratricopeptide (TPR) repeat protein
MPESANTFQSSEYCARGATEFSLGRYQDAALTYSVVATSQPENPDAMYNFALCLERCERWDAAAGAFERVLSMDAGRSEARLALASCLLKMNRAEEALENFDGACIGDDRETALFGKAVALQMLQRFDEAANIYATLLECAPHKAEILSNWIALAIETQDFAKARELSRRLLDSDPRSAVALQGLATVALQHADYDAAASYCQQLLDLSPDSLEAWHNLRIAAGQLDFGPAQPAFTLYAGGKR